MVGIGIIVCAVVVVSDHPTYSHVWLAGSEEWLRAEYCVLDEWEGTFSMGGWGLAMNIVDFIIYRAIDQINDVCLIACQRCVACACPE